MESYQIRQICDENNALVLKKYLIEVKVRLLLWAYLICYSKDKVEIYDNRDNLRSKHNIFCDLLSVFMFSRVLD